MAFYKNLFNHPMNINVKMILQNFNYFIALIRVEWNPKVCVIDNRLNRAKFTDTTVAPRERASVISDEQNTIIGPLVPPSTEAQIHRICDSIGKHIQRVTKTCHTLKNMSFYAKIDKDHKLWFMWFSSMRTTTVGGILNVPSKILEFSVLESTNNGDEQEQQLLSASTLLAHSSDAADSSLPAIEKKPSLSNLPKRKQMMSVQTMPDELMVCPQCKQQFGMQILLSNKRE